MRYAYVTFLMKNDSYFPGAFVLANTMKNYDNVDFVCMITDEISQKVKQALTLVFDEVIEINKIKLKHNIKNGRQDRGDLLTRFSALLLEYDKIILLDADVLPLASITELFELPAPAGIINKRKEYFIPAEQERNLKANKKWHEIYDEICPHGLKIPHYITDRVRHDVTNLGVNSALWRLDPNKDEYKNILKALQEPEILSLFQNFRWPEMQLATLLWSGKWTNIDVKYCAIGGYPNIEFLKTIHFAGLKPWNINNKSLKTFARYKDFKAWYAAFLAAFYTFPSLKDFTMMKRIEEFIIYNKILI